MKLQTVKGFKDYLPAEALKRQFVIDKIRNSFKKFGFEPLETPTLEYAETLLGKYGEEEKLIYKFTTLGGDEVALKYDQTVPLARVIAQYGPNGAQTLPLPFKRYQIQSAYRGENTQKGRYREFTQCDADIIGVSSPVADAEILALVYDIYTNLGLDVVIKINDRALIADIEPKYLAAIDKLNKIGTEGILKELESKGLSATQAKELLEKCQSLEKSENLKQIEKLYTELGYPAESLVFDSALIRGLDYYTGLILEVVLKDNQTGSSLCGGGRWDKMIGKFTGTDQAAVGFAIGLDRTIEAMEEAGLTPKEITTTQVLVTIFSADLAEKSLETVAKLRSAGVASEIWLEPTSRLDKQLKYADQKQIPYVVIIGPDEAAQNKVVLKDLKNRTQETLSLDELTQKLAQ